MTRIIFKELRHIGYLRLSTRNDTTPFFRVIKNKCFFTLTYNPGINRPDFRTGIHQSFHQISLGARADLKNSLAF